MRKKDPNELNKREKAILKYIEKAVWKTDIHHQLEK